MSGESDTAPDGDPGAFDTLILGIGNVLWADEGFGIRAVEALHARYRFGASVRLMDGGTQGIFLLPWVRSARQLLIFDAVDYGLEPATLKVIHGDDVPRYMGAKKMSMHQAGFAEVLATARLSGSLPQPLVLVGVQPKLLDDFGGSLTPQVRACIEPAVTLATDILTQWGVTLTPRDAPPGDAEHIGPHALSINDYESGRPCPGGQTP